jgi:hypothetical protein
MRAAIGMAARWCSEVRLHLAREKAEVILLTMKRISISFNFDVGRREDLH